MSHSASPLPDGRVVILGGFGGGTFGVKTVEAAVWDPATGEVTSAGQLLRPRANHTATVLDEGRVLVLGGDLNQDGGLEGTRDEAEIWTPGAQE
jgi:hypothetical protein